jgi:hypothetical protein
MRTQFVPYVRLIGLIAGGLVGAAGCDNVTAGTSGDPPGPVKLVRVLIQDGASSGSARKFAVDLLEKDPLTPCDDVNICTAQYAIQGTYPGANCSAPAGMSGTCVDPLLVPKGGVPIEPAVGTAKGGVAIRIVFNKLLLDSTVNNPVDMGLATFIDGVAELIGPDGTTKVPCDKFWDLAGSPDFTSDVIKSPFGPAIVLKPQAELAPNTNYTVRLHPSTLKDREMNSPVDSSGTPLPDPYDQTFKTENIKLRASKSYPTAYTPTPTIAPNEVLSFLFWGPIVASPKGDSSVVMLNVMSGPLTAAQILAYTKTTVDPTMMCNTSSGKGVWLYLTPAPAASPATQWPAGDYTLSFTLTDPTGAGSYTSPALSFTVGGAPGDSTDANVIGNMGGPPPPPTCP